MREQEYYLSMELYKKALNMSKESNLKRNQLMMMAKCYNTIELYEHSLDCSN